jgi:hypothetical protein
MIKIINEGIFSAIAESFGAGNLWKVIKGRFLQLIRGWVGIADIWKAETQEELDEAYNLYIRDVEQIKGRYRQAESQFAENNSIWNSTYGDHMMFMHPGLALTQALVGPLMDQTYRQDTRSLLAYSGIERLGLTPDFISKWIDEQPDDEKRLTRTTSTDDKGVTTTSDTFVYIPKDKSDKVSQIMSLFVSENVEDHLPIITESFSKNDAKQMALKISKAYESEGIFAEMTSVAEGILENKKNLIAEVVTPSTKTIDLISRLLSAENPEVFSQTMEQISKINPKLADLSPGDFISQIDNSVQQVKNDEESMASIKNELKLTEVDDAILRNIVFESARNNFSRVTLESLEVIYEKTIELLMEGITEKGLKLMKGTPVGKEYADLIENNIQTLENAILSLDRISK